MTLFKLKNDRLLETILKQEKVMALAGSMVAYEGSVKFEKALLGGEGLLGVVKRKFTSETVDLMVCKGTGTIYFAHKAKEVSVISLEGEKLVVESSNLLASDDSLKTDVAFAGLRGATSGQGLFTTTLEGIGSVALLSEGNLIMLEVSSSYPLCVDPDAFVGYKGNVRQEFIFDVNWKTVVGETSGETYQLKFTGSGVVYIQPSERQKPQS
ncbi:AIM24 family protein [Lusitaniella coriacea LEGE 07157]|uniref:AIM24 family protein n=1 Tax=Lusitaniella coriacea LEGE 07157 TaxID=945747 RepID=A0A8J7DNH1_9CYAN|nr:AIM24 family protein [Lusitaniella coriacea]MBE9114579.1 AIM24 family protein [Lusitaniella coriacea LEGE 07157]